MPFGAIPKPIPLKTASLAIAFCDADDMVSLKRRDSMALSDYDKQAVFAILARAHRLQEQNKVDEEAMREINQRLMSARTKINQGIAALSLFGIENKPGGNIWDEVKEVLGAERYNAAIAAGKRPEGAPVEEPPITNPDEEEDGEAGDEAASDDPNVLAEVASPKISDAIIELLESKWPEGVKVADVKSFLKATYNIDTHEKTPGMTLYRLSQQVPPLVKREKRVWFLAKDPKVEMEEAV
jgi:hypothetical protein